MTLHARQSLAFPIAALVVSLFVFMAATAASPCELAGDVRRVAVRDFNAAGDGKTDDGPAIREAIKAALAGAKPVAVEFEAGKTYRITSFEDTYALQIANAEKVTLQGNGAELSLLPPNKVMSISNSSEINVCGLTIDYSPLPFTQGLIVAADKATGTFDLEIEPGFDVPNVDDNSVTDNSKVWRFAFPYKSPEKFERRIQVKAVYAAPGARRIRIAPINAGDLDRLQPNETHLVMTMPGMGQTGGFAFRVINNDRVHFESIKIYAVPHHTFFVGDNLGLVSFSNTEQRRRPGTTRVMTSWRSIFFTRNNRAPVSWDGCFVEGAFDDSFARSASYQLVVEKLDDNRWRLRDLTVAKSAPVFKSGDRLQAIDLMPDRKLLGETKIVSVIQNGKESVVTISPPLPLKGRLDFCKGVKERRDICGTRLVDLDAADESSTIKGCTVHGSLRLGSNITVERSKFDGALRITVDPTRAGPLPAGVVIQDSELSGVIRIGSDHPFPGATYESWAHGERWARDIILQNDRIDAVIKTDGATLTLINDDILSPIRKVFQLSNSAIHIKNLTAAGRKIADPMSRIKIGPSMTVRDIVIDAGDR